MYTVTLFGNDTEGVMNYRCAVSPNRSYSGPADLFTTTVQLPNVFLLIFNKQLLLLGFYRPPGAVFCLSNHPETRCSLFDSNLKFICCCMDTYRQIILSNY